MKKLLLLIAFLMPTPASAQDMEPRAYSNAPVGMSFLILSYINSSGNVLFDSRLPVEDVQAEVHTGLLAYVRVVNVWGRSGKVAVLLPYSWADARGLLAG